MWEKCRKILEKVDPEVPTKPLDAVEGCIGQFSDIDPISEAFRYPRDKKGNPSLPSDLTHINLRNLSDVMARMSTLLDGASFGISVYLDYRREMNDWY